MKKINTYKIISKFYAGVLATMLLALPFSLFAQEVPAEASVPAVDSSQTPSAPEFVPAQDPSLTSVASLPAEVVTHPVEIIAPELTQSQSSNSPQDTQTDQQSAASSVIETTSNPQLSIDTSALSSSVSTTPTTTTSTSTPVSTPLDPAVPEVVPYVDPADEVVTVNQSQAILVSVQVPAIDPVVQFVPTDIVPKEKYTFTLDTVAIPTKPDVNSPVDDSKKKVAKPLVTAMPRFSLDSNTGNLSVSGKCSDPYFVVLVYGNAADYDLSLIHI